MLKISSGYSSNRFSSTLNDNYNSFCTFSHKIDKNNYNRNKANNINTYNRFINFINYQNFKTINYIDYHNEKANNLFIKQTFEKTENIGIKSSTASTSSSISSDSLSSSPTSSAFSISPSLSNNFVSSSLSNKPKISYLVKSQSICLSKQNSNQTKHQYSEIKKSNSVRKYDPRTVQKSLLEWCQIKTKNYQVNLNQN
jgi:hypothetical protein